MNFYLEEKIYPEEELLKHLNYLKHCYKEIVFACVGTNIIALKETHHLDNFGPMVGSLLSQELPNVYGTMENPIQYSNLKMKRAQIHEEHPHAFVLAIDAVCGTYIKPTGSILYESNPLQAAAATGKIPIEIGKAFLGCIVINRDEKINFVLNAREKVNKQYGDVISYEQLKQKTEELSKVLIKGMKSPKNHFYSQSF